MHPLIRSLGAAATCAALSSFGLAAAQGLAAVGPVSPIHGFPEWYEDGNGVRLELCLENNGLCVLPGPVNDPVPGLPFPDNYGGTFPDEAFYWFGEALMPSNGGGNALLVMGLESTFLNAPVVADGDQLVFARVRIRVDNLVDGATYTVTTPVGVFSFVAQGAGPRGINFTDDNGGILIPLDFTTALGAGVGPFLAWDSDRPILDAMGNEYLGDPNILHTITGGASGNVFRVEGPSVGGPGVDLIETDLFAVAGKIFNDPTPVPVADFTAAPTMGDAPLAVAFTDLSTGTVTSWAWDFGDGTSSSVQNPSHTYVTPGTYSPSLTATGPTGMDVLTLPGLIAVSAPPPAPMAGFSAAPTSGDAPLSVAFTDLSTGAITSWTWDFGDGSSASMQSPIHIYATPGTYTPSLTVAGPTGIDTASQPGLIVVTAPPPVPVAAFSATPTSGDAPLAVSFTDLSTGAITSWAWDFGDGSSSSMQSPTHTYVTPGTYSASLTVAGPGGMDTLSQPGLISVLAPPPVPMAAFSAAPTSGDAPLAVAFTDLSAGTITSWAWDFGDGSSSSLQNPTHTYMMSGTYTPSLTVTGPTGTDTLSQLDLISVLAPPPAPVAAFAAVPTSGNAPLSVAFMDQSSGTVTSWAWDFGDGTGSSLQNPTHTYVAAGTYTPSLAVSGPTGSDALAQPGLISVTTPPPGVFELSLSPGVVNVQNLLTATNATDGGIVAFVFGFRPGPRTIHPSACAAGIMMGMTDPRLLGFNLSVGGTATFQVLVPPNVAGTTVLLQAIDMASCTATPLLTHTF